MGISVPLQKLKEVQSFAKGHTVNKWPKMGFELRVNLKPVPLLLLSDGGCLCLQDGQESGWHVAPLEGVTHITVCLLGIPGLAVHSV